jgi:hypothetical protein
VKPIRPRVWRSLTLRLPPEVHKRLDGIQLPRGLCAAEAFFCWFEAMENGRPLCVKNWRAEEGVPGGYEKTYLRRRYRGGCKRADEGSAESSK